AAWIGAVALLRRPAHALVAMVGASALTLAVSLGSYADAPVHTIVNALYAAGATAVAIRMKDRRILWIAAALALLSALGAYRWSGALPVWAPVFALVPAAIAFAGTDIPPTRSLRGTLMQISIAVSVFAAALGLASGPSAAPWDADVWRTTMLAVAAALAIVPTIGRAGDFTTLIAGLAIAFVLLGAAARWQLTPTARVALLALTWLAVSRIYVDPRIDEIKMVAGALLLALCVVSI